MHWVKLWQGKTWYLSCPSDAPHFPGWCAKLVCLTSRNCFTKLKMYKHFAHHNGNKSSENASDLRKNLNEIHSMKINTEVRFSIVEEELKSLTKKDHKLK